MIELHFGAHNHDNHVLLQKIYNSTHNHDSKGRQWETEGGQQREIFQKWDLLI